MKDQLDRIEATLARIEAQLNPKAAPPECDGDKHNQRIATLELLFWRVVNSPRERREKNYHVPKYLLESPSQPHAEGFTLSVLVNHASLRQLFKGVSKEEIARIVSEDSNLVVVDASELPGSNRETKLVVSPGFAAEVLGRDIDDLPGWSIPRSQRGVLRRNAVTGKTDKPQPDPTGERSSDVEEQSEVKVEDAPAKKVRLDFGV